MKTLKLIPFLLIFASGCTETIYDEVIKEVRKDSIIIVTKNDTIWALRSRTDTVFVDRIRIDSVSYPVFVSVYDTMYIPQDVIVYDTLYLAGETVYVYDTIHVVQHHYADTMYIPLGWSTTSIGEYEGAVSEFYTKAAEYGWEPWGGDILIQPWTHDEAPPASRSSYSFWYFDQFILKIKDTLTPDEAYTPIFRELARWQLGKKYTNEPDDIMNPDFDWKRLKLSDSDAKKKPFLDVLFSKEPI